MAEPPIIAIVGRPNVGKSTLVNRLAGRREAIVEEKPGVTRDRKDVDIEWVGRSFRVVDTGGWLPGGSTLDAKVSRQAERAVDEADLVLLVVDVTTGITDEDDRVADLLRKRNRPVIVVANKVDDTAREGEAWAFTRLGLGDPVGISALHGRSTGDLLDQIAARVPLAEGDAEAVGARDEPEETKTPGVAIVGRPNVGKSTLFNRIVGDERSIVHDLPGTTRDAIDTIVETPEGPLVLIDTAGMRRKARIDEGTEYFSMVRALQAIDRADAALLVIDASEGVTHQDQRLAERVDAAGCPIVVVLNKWDLVATEARNDVLAGLNDRLRFLQYAPVLKMSARTGRGVQRLMPALQQSISEYHRRVPTASLNRVVRTAQAAQPAPGGARVLYATQGATDPPTITLFANREVPQTYLRYLERQIREAFDFGATPIKLRVRRRSD